MKLTASLRTFVLLCITVSLCNGQGYIRLSHRTVPSMSAGQGYIRLSHRADPLMSSSLDPNNIDMQESADATALIQNPPMLHQYMTNLSELKRKVGPNDQLFNYMFRKYMDENGNRRESDYEKIRLGYAPLAY